jgi:Membrane proteins related to metalloendopeptidases
LNGRYGQRRRTTGSKRYYYGRREQAESTATIALLAQGAVCLLLVLAVYFVKQNDAALYQLLQREYRIMLTDPGQSEAVMAMAGQAKESADDLLLRIEGWIDHLFWPPQGTGEPPDAAGVLRERVVEDSYQQPPDTALLESSGQGGWLPVGKNDAEKQLPPPSGMSLSPVYLNANMRPPLAGRITSLFAYRLHPVTQSSDFHTGIDIAAPEGSAICAVLPGRVEEVGKSAIYGNYVVLRHADNLQTSYSHCSEVIAKEGDMVRQGERIAKVGQTGVATGPHLHFSVIADDYHVDPYWLLCDYIQAVTL